MYFRRSSYTAHESITKEKAISDFPCLALLPREKKFQISTRVSAFDIEYLPSALQILAIIGKMFDYLVYEIADYSFYSYREYVGF